MDYGVAAAKATSVMNKVELLEKAVALYQGKLLSSVASEHWLIHQANHYHLAYMSTVNELLKQLMSLNACDLIHQYAAMALTIAPENTKAYYSVVYLSVEIHSLLEGTMKNILVIQGGGRAKGNTAQLIDSFAAGAKAAGHSVEIISLMKNEVKGCLGCNACRYGKPCIQKDAFNGLVPKIKAADCIVFASPLYFWTFSSRLKAFIERFYCIAEEDPNPSLGRYEKYPVKDCALLMTSADDFFWTFEQAVSYYQFALVNYIGFHDKGMVLAGGCGDTNGRPQIRTESLQKAYEFGRAIYKE